MASPTITQFLSGIDGFVTARNPASLADYLALEPPFAPLYQQMINELRQAYPARGANNTNSAPLEDLCSQSLPAARSESWNAFVKFMAQYLAYLRDVSSETERYLATYESLKELLQRANSALANVELGHLMLPTVVSCARCVCRLAIGLDKQPELIAHLRSAGGDEDGGARETLPERAANIVRQAFVTCLNDRSASLSASGEPQGKARGIYALANLCLKILFQCRKTRNAVQLFENIYHQAPPLSAYPKAERVTYLYYLGRFLFTTAHYNRARRALQAAYDECPANEACTPQRRSILIYLLSSNLLLGRFPSATLLSRPEAAGLEARFAPLCRAIQRGDLAAFDAHLSLNSPHAPWFLHFRLLMPLRHRGEVLVWRGLVRRTWLLNGTRPTLESRVTPTVDMADLEALLSFFRQKRRTTPQQDPDFAGTPHNSGPPAAASPEQTTSIVASLIAQKLLNGFIHHGRGKYAITGLKATGGDILAAGFPPPSRVLIPRPGDEEDDVPGWPTADKATAPKFGAGMVVNLRGARGVGG